MAHSELFFLYCIRMEVTTCIIFEELPWFSYSKYQFYLLWLCVARQTQCPTLDQWLTLAKLTIQYSYLLFIVYLFFNPFQMASNYDPERSSKNWMARITFEDCRSRSIEGTKIRMGLQKEMGRQLFVACKLL